MEALLHLPLHELTTSALLHEHGRVTLRPAEHGDVHIFVAHGFGGVHLGGLHSQGGLVGRGGAEVRVPFGALWAAVHSTAASPEKSRAPDHRYRWLSTVAHFAASETCVGARAAVQV